MMSRQESTTPGRWSELLLGGTVAGVGAPLLLKGVHRWLHLGRGGTPSAVGWAAGLLGALVAGGLARRHQRTAAPEAPAPDSPEARTDAPAPVEDAEAGDAVEEELVADWRREVRRRRLAALTPRAATPEAGPGHELPRPVVRGPRRGPSGREQPWHEDLEAVPA